MGKLEIESELDRLYALPLAEFVDARNELAKGLRTGGDRRAADEIKALAKPSMTAWAVNALYHHERKRFDELLEAAVAVRAALSGKGDRRKADAERRKVLQGLLGRAAKMLAKAGHAATPANRQRISHTLEALAAHDPAEDGPRPGRLTRDLEPQGFDVLAGLAASLVSASPAISPSTTSNPRAGEKASAGAAATSGQADRIAAARRKVEEHQAAVARLQRDVEEAQATADETVERHERLGEKLAEAKRRAQDAAEQAAAAKSDMGAAKAAAAKAKAAWRRGLSRLATAQRQLGRLDG